MNLLEFLLVLFLVVVPVYAIALRILLNPMVEAIIRLRGAFVACSAEHFADRRVLELEEQLRDLRQTLHERHALRDADDRAIRHPAKSRGAVEIAESG